MTGNNNWFDELPAGMIICNENGIILEMNQKAQETMGKYGGAELIGKSLLDCHPEPARSKLKELMKSQKANCYTIERGEIKKMIYQTPWFKDGRYRGFVEFSIEIPKEMPHFIRS
jgi:PAS domain S-box-containing protein